MRAITSSVATASCCGAEEENGGGGGADAVDDGTGGATLIGTVDRTPRSTRSTARRLKAAGNCISTGLRPVTHNQIDDPHAARQQGAWVVAASGQQMLKLLD